MPSPFGEDSELCRMLRTIAPKFEHRLFLTATPHNGHTRSFSGLLELLDPVRFSRTDELKPAEKERVKQVVIRRLKREINARTDPPRFCNRKPPQALVLGFSPTEQQLIDAVGALRAKVRSVIALESKNRRLAGSFALEILGKRLLSGPVTFADSWRRCKLGLIEEEAAGDKDVAAAEKSVHEDTADDLEYQQREATAASVIGAWLKAIAAEVDEEIRATDRAVEGLGLDLGQANVTGQNPTCDARYEQLTALIGQLLRHGDSWKADERLVIFTEYKTSLDYLLRRLREDYRGEEERFLSLYGGMDDGEREQIKEQFNDPNAAVRVLVATDAASEGLNLQATARYLLHFDCPWNPAKLEQRNGRLDRHGQARDVQIFHFASEQDADLKFLAHLVGKVDQIREDLGAVGEVLDEATHRRLVQGEDADAVKQDLDTLAAEIDLDPDAQRETLETAMSIHAGRPQLSEPDEERRCRIINPSLSGWSDTIDETVRRNATGSGLGPVPYLAFDAHPFIKLVGGRPIFRPRTDTLMVHLGHPLMGRALGSLTRRRFPGPGAVSRWTVRLGDVPEGADALILLHLEELAVNQLRETFHHWIRTLSLPVRDGELGRPLAHTPALQLRGAEESRENALIDRARDLLDEVEADLQQLAKRCREELTDKLREQLNKDGEKARETEDQRYRSRQGEVSALIVENTLAKLERDIRRLKAERTQGRLWASQALLDEIDRSIEAKEQEQQRRHQHYEDVREQLARERQSLRLVEQSPARWPAARYPAACEPRPRGPRAAGRFSAGPPPPADYHLRRRPRGKPQQARRLRAGVDLRFRPPRGRLGPGRERLHGLVSPGRHRRVDPPAPPVEEPRRSCFAGVHRQREAARRGSRQTGHKPCPPVAPPGRRAVGRRHQRSAVAAGLRRARLRRLLRVGHRPLVQRGRTLR